MYGTVARMRLIDGAEVEMDRLVAEDQVSTTSLGLLGEYIFRSDADPHEYFLVVLFESRDAYQANARSPEQHQRYVRFRALLEDDPEWHDGEVAFALQPRVATQSGVGGI